MTVEEIVDHHTDPEGMVLAAKKADAPNYLGDTIVIDHLLSELAKGIVIRYGQVCDGKITPDEASRADREACLGLGAIFAGENSEYKPVAGWNGEVLADFIRNQANLGDDTDPPSTIIGHALAEFSLLIYNTISSEVAELDMANTINEGIKSLTMLLIGVQSYD